MTEEIQASTALPNPNTVGLSAGSRLAGYRLEHPIGNGGMGMVFRAVDERLGRPVALKILTPALAADDAFRRRFIRESRAAAAVDDPHIIPVFEAGEASGVLFIAMRYVPGGDVRTLVRREGPMPAGRAAAIVSAVASALDAAHAVDLIHRDVKPANMLLDVRPHRPDHVYLADFGLSKTSLPATDLTGTGEFMGTLDYCAPEQIEGRAVDGRADQYSLACTAFELLSGAPPFQRDQPAAMIWAHMSQPPPLLTQRRPDLPPEADQVLAKAMAKAPEHRYETCHEFAQALRQAIGLPPYHSSPGEAAPDDLSVAESDGVAAAPRCGNLAPGKSRRTKRPWKRDWTAWALILALPAVVIAALIGQAGAVGNGIGLGMFVIAVLAVPVALLTKLARWARRRRASR